MEGELCERHFFALMGELEVATNIAEVAWQNLKDKYSERPDRITR
jgi:hypothetical protein